MFNKRTLAFACMVVVCSSLRTAHGQDLQKAIVVSLQPVKGLRAKTNLAPELVATRISGGTLTGATETGDFIIASPVEKGVKELSANPILKSMSAEVPTKYQPITRLRISYSANRKLTPANLKELGLKLVEDYKKGTFLVVEPADGITAALTGALEKSARVEYAAAVFRVKVIEPPEPRKRPEKASTRGAPPTNDPLWDELWGMRNIRAPKAWDQVTESPVIVAVIDTGVFYEHPDLEKDMWINPKESANGADDDGNGLVDDIYGADFENGDGDPTDDHGHGTHCAGTVGAVGNNATGVVGVNWRVSIMALKWINAAGGGEVVNAVKCIDYAVEHGAKVLSNSWHWLGPDPELEAAIERARDAGVLFVVAAGNDWKDNDVQPTFPASYPTENIISVLSINEDESLSWFSNYGKVSVDIGAPGNPIHSTVPPNLNMYGDMSGTSMATPHVAGAAALTWGHPHYNSVSWSDVKNTLLQSARPLPSLSGKCVTDGTLDIAFLGVGSPPPRAAYLGCQGTHHLAGETGTALYCWRCDRWLVNLVYDKSDKHYWYYHEKEYPGYKWAFGKEHDCCCRHAVWFLPGGESSGKWVFYQYARRVLPINANQAAAKARRK